MKKIIIIGSNGLVGQALVNYFQEINNYELIAISKNHNINPNLNSKFESIDITNYTEINYILSLYNPDVIINTAAVSSIDECENDKNNCTNVNFLAVKNISEFCIKNDIHFIHFSSDFIFQGTKHNYNENDIAEPVNFYGQTKLDAEKEIISNNNISTIIRVELVYGYLKNLAKQNILTWVLNNLKNNTKIKVVSDQYRTPTYVYDIAFATEQIINNKEFGIFNIGGTETYSIFEIATKIAEIFNLNNKLISPVLTYDLNEKTKRPLNTSFCIDKAKNILNYRPNSLSENLTKIKNAIR